MFEQFTEQARRVFFFARYEASQYGSTRIETSTSCWVSDPESALFAFILQMDGRILSVGRGAGAQAPAGA